jgi:fructokinase
MTTALDVVCIGETLVDFFPLENGQRVRDVVTWQRSQGGSPANVAVGLARLGAKSAMLGVVGEDEFGAFLVESLAREGVDTSHLRRSPEGKTGLVFISLDAQGERSFSFYRQRAAEFLLGEQDVDVEFLARARAVHCGTNSLIKPEARAAAVKLVKSARASGKLVSCDPNLRLHLWTEPTALREVLGQIFELCSVAKLAEDEIEFATDTRDPSQALQRLLEMGVRLPIVTLGAAGAVFLWDGVEERVHAPRVKVVDATGAGDGFTSTLLYGLTRLCADAGDLEELSREVIRELVTFACVAGARVVEQRGAVAGLPRLHDLQGFVPRFLVPPKPSRY